MDEAEAKLGTGRGRACPPLPPRKTTGPDADGYKTRVDFRFDHDGNVKKVTTTTRVHKLAVVRRTKEALERRKWAKFGDAADGDERSAFTVVSQEEIFLRTRSNEGPVMGAQIYVPPKRVAAVDTPRGRNTVALRVINWPEDGDDTDLEHLFISFGRLRNVSVATNPKTGRSKGFGIVNFVKRADAEVAKESIDGFKYGNLVLRVEWATGA